MEGEAYPGGLHFLLATLGALDVIPVELQGPRGALRQVGIHQVRAGAAGHSETMRQAAPAPRPNHPRCLRICDLLPEVRLGVGSVGDVVQP